MNADAFNFIRQKVERILGSKEKKGSRTRVLDKVNTLVLDSRLVVLRGRQGGEMVNVVLDMFLLRCPGSSQVGNTYLSIRATKSDTQKRNLH